MSSNSYRGDCIFVQNPINKEKGIMISAKKFQQIVDDYAVQHDEKDYDSKEAKIDIYDIAWRNKYFDCSYSEWKRMKAPKPFKAEY